jgi:hypothetical protein
MTFDANASQDDSDSRPLPPPVQAPVADAGAAPATAADAAEDSVAPVWLQRLSLFVLVLFCVYLGVMVTILPWWTRVWDRNLFIQSHPALAAVLYNGAVRGLISGLGLLDIWIGISEAIHYREQRR